MSKTVLFATDYSPASRNVLPYAASLASQQGAKLLIMHVLEREQYPEGEQFDEDEGPARVDEAICQLAKDEAVDMIVIGTHGHSAIGSVMGGSVADRVVKHAPCPVVAVKHL